MRRPPLSFPTWMERLSARLRGRTLLEIVSGVLSRPLRHPVGIHLLVVVLPRRVPLVLLAAAILLQLPALLRRGLLAVLLLRLLLDLRLGLVLPLALLLVLLLVLVPLQVAAVAAVAVQAAALLSVTLVTPLLRRGIERI